MKNISEDFKAILDFMNEIEQLKSTLRHNWTKTGRQESSAEHTWRATLLSIILIDILDIELDKIKLIKMLLIHDIPEVTFGDIPAWQKENREEKKKREHENAKNIFNKLPKKYADEFNSLFLEFEEGVSIEAKVGQAIEKIESQLQHRESGSKYWGVEETGEHMINYPNKALRALGNSQLTEFWNLIKIEIEKITSEIGR